MSLKIINLANGVEGLFVKNERFNTTRISCNMFLPLSEKDIAENALLPFILTACCKKYPSFSRLNYKLNKLYGARLDASAEKYGDFHFLRMSISVINDRFALDGDSLVKQATQLLVRLIFEPNTENEEFLEYDVEREKRKCIEHIKSELSEKRIYAKNRMLEEMYEGSVYGLSKCGSIEQVNAISGKSLYTAWQKALSSAFIRFNVIGATIPTGLFEEISDRFNQMERKDITDCKKSSPTSERAEPKTVTDRMEVNQGKLVMGFSSDCYGNDEETLPLMVMNDIFGGGPYSRLFSNVREKMSLCYYCSSAAVRQKGLLLVQSGVETANCKKAEQEILNQLEIVKKGEFSDFEFNSSIKSICDSFKTFEDSPAALDSWYTVKINNNEIYSPDQLAEMVAKVTKEDVVNAAKGVKLNTVYELLPKEENL